MKLPIVRVTVSEDRALVVREGTVRVGEGTTRCRLEGVAPVCVDKSLRATVLSGSAKIAEARVVRERRAALPDDPAERSEIQALDAEIDRLADVLEDLAAADAAARAELALLEAGARASLEDASWDTAHGRAPADVGLAAIEAREKELHAELVRLSIERRERLAEHERALRRRRAADHPSTHTRAAIELVLSAPAAGEVRLALEYMVPGACWRPQHTATLRDDGVQLSTDGCVWQNTGESWDGVELRLSTERPSLGQEPPLLSDDRLSVQRRAEVVQVEAREERVETAGLGAGAPLRIPGIDDGGDPRVLVARDAAHIPSDGRPYRVPLGEIRCEATQALVCMPQLTAALILRTEQQNRGSTPLLAGPVDLVRNGGFVGRTTLPFIAPGEIFELGWGADPGVRVHLHIEEVEEEPGLLSGRIVRKIRERVRISVLDRKLRTFTVTMRMPVSEIERVEIAQLLRDTTAKTKGDADGFVRFPITLAAHGRQTIDLAYTLERHRDVVGL